MSKSKNKIINAFLNYFKNKPLFEIEKSTKVYRINWHEENAKTIGHWYAIERDHALQYLNYGAQDRTNKKQLPYLIEGEIKEAIILREVNENHLAVFERIYEGNFNHLQVAQDSQTLYEHMSPNFHGFIRLKDDTFENEIFLTFPNKIIKEISITKLPSP